MSLWLFVGVVVIVIDVVIASYLPMLRYAFSCRRIAFSRILLRSCILAVCVCVFACCRSAACIAHSSFASSSLAASLLSSRLVLYDRDSRTEANMFMALARHFSFPGPYTQHTTYASHVSAF